MQISRQQVKLFSSLKDKRIRQENGLFIAEGKKVVYDLAASGISPEWLLVTEEHQDFSLPVPPAQGKHFITSTQKEQISQLSTPPGIIGIFALPAVQPVKTIPSGWSLFLDGISDPGNLGAIIRTAHWFHLRKIILGKDTADPFNPKVVQATMGSLGFIEFLAPEESFAAQDLKDIPVYTADLAGKPVNRFSNPQPGMIVLGSESHGISGIWKEKATEQVYIPPMHPSEHPESLNVAVSTGIILGKFLGDSG